MHWQLIDILNCWHWVARWPEQIRSTWIPYLHDTKKNENSVLCTMFCHWWC